MPRKKKPRARELVPLYERDLPTIFDDPQDIERKAGRVIRRLAAMADTTENEGIEFKCVNAIKELTSLAKPKIDLHATAVVVDPQMVAALANRPIAELERIARGELTEAPA